MEIVLSAVIGAVSAIIVAVMNNWQRDKKRDRNITNIIIEHNLSSEDYQIVEPNTKKIQLTSLSSSKEKPRFIFIK